MELDGAAGVVGATGLDDEGVVDWEAMGELEDTWIELEAARLLVGMTAEEEAGDEAGDEAGELEETGELEGLAMGVELGLAVGVTV